MHDTNVKMKDGTTYCAPMWKWRPREGWFSLIRLSDDEPTRIELDDVESMVTKNQRCRRGLEGIGDEDELWRAINEGWTPKGETTVTAIIWEDTEEHAPDGVETWDDLRDAAEAIGEDHRIMRHNVGCNFVYYWDGGQR